MHGNVLKISDMKKIPLTKGQFALVDDDDFNWLIQWKWNAMYHGGKYVATRHHKSGASKTYMHRLIINAPSGMEVDHIDHNTLNNQRNNLRICDHSLNCKNRSPWGQSKYLGVSKLPSGKWRAAIRANGRTMHLGCFINEYDAALAYDDNARKYHGDFANLNFKAIDATNTKADGENAL